MVSPYQVVGLRTHRSGRDPPTVFDLIEEPFAQIATSAGLKSIVVSLGQDVGLMRSFFRSKIHRATVTHANLHYEGSLSIDRSLMEAADIAEFEEVHVWNVTRGTRLTTYAIEAEIGSGIICANGAAAHQVKVGDVIIIATFVLLKGPEDLPQPRVILVDDNNRVKAIRQEVAGPNRVLAL